jgi:sialate O-acetylesterase
MAMVAGAQVLKSLHDLRGSWKLEIGDDIDWARPDFDDSRWAIVTVPSAWEDQGFPGYDGFAWYRTEFHAPSDWKDKSLYLLLGYVDDVDEVYLNGHFLAFQGQFPPNYVEAYNIPRQYYLPVDYLNLSGPNTIAVRVYDHMMAGGIVKGRIGIYQDLQAVVPEFSLSGTWLFSRGDDLGRKALSFDDRDWTEVYVPAYWETQGFKGYNGYGWYRKSFRIPPDLKGKKLVLLLGRIDDLDETYLNGHRIGRTGVFPPRDNIIGTDEYLRLRAYTIPPDILREDQDNVIAVRVYDGWLHGGIYEVPVGIVSRENYMAWRREIDEEEQSTLEKMLERIFD